MTKAEHIFPDLEEAFIGCVSAKNKMWRKVAVCPNIVSARAVGWWWKSSGYKNLEKLLPAPVRDHPRLTKSKLNSCPTKKNFLTAALSSSNTNTKTQSQSSTLPRQSNSGLLPHQTFELVALFTLFSNENVYFVFQLTSLLIYPQCEWLSIV